MRVAAIALCLSFLPFAAPALAQPAVPAVEIFSGYSVLPANGDDFPRRRSHGIHLAVSANLASWFAVVADVANHFNTARDLGPGFEGLVARTRVDQFLVGPRFVARSRDGVNVFAHGLVGLARGDAGEEFSGFSDRGLALGGGGGVDVHLRRRLSIRGQFDLLGAFVDIMEVNSRFGVGLVVNVGGS